MIPDGLKLAFHPIIRQPHVDPLGRARRDSYEPAIAATVGARRGRPGPCSLMWSRSLRPAQTWPNSPSAGAGGGSR